MSRFIRTRMLCLSTLLLFVVSAQAQYYWSHDRKINLNEDRTAAVIQFLQRPNTNTLLPQLSNHPTVETVEWHEAAQRLLVTFKNPQAAQAAALIKSLNLNPTSIRSLSYAYRLDSGFPLWLTHHIVLELQRNFAPEALLEFIDNKNVTVVKSEYDVLTLDVQNINDVIPIANKIRESGLVKWCHPDFYAKATRYADPLYPEQFHLDNTGQRLDGYRGLNDIDCNAPEAWEISKGSSSTLVAVIDDGLEDHEDLKTVSGASRIIGGYTPATRGNGSPNPDGAHGESCAGIIAASHNNIGVRGVAPEVSLLSVNIFAGGETAAQLAEAINWARTNGADVMNNSWGFPNCELALDVLTNAIENALTNGRDGKGSVVVFAAGNDGRGCVDYPANLPGVISVGAITNQGYRSAYSNYGTALSLVAPSNGAAGVRTIDRMGARGYNPGSYAKDFGGTSAACPVVSGVAALIISANPDLTEAQVRNFILSTATDMGSIGRDNYYGTGRVNAFAALQAALAEDGGEEEEEDDYCTSSSADTNDEWISSLKIGNFTKTSTSTSYSDFTNETIPLQAGTSYNVTVNVRYGGQTYQEAVRIWIDWNGDKTFSTNEVVFEKAAFTTTATGSFSVPATAAGTTTRMRVSLKYESLPSPCETLEYGEVEDYTVTVTAGSGGGEAQGCPVPTGLVVAGITTTDATLSWDVASDATTYDVQVRPAGGEWEIFEDIDDTALPLTGFSAGETYQWRVRSNCGVDNTSDWSAIAEFTFETAPDGYCEAGGEISDYQWIDLVELNNLSNETGNDGGYGDYTNLTAVVQRGTSPTLYMSKGPNTNYRFYWTVFIDFNQDGDFTDSDELLLSGSSTSNGRLYSKLHIPLSAKLGNTRMRIAMKYASAASPCEIFEYGEVEDYTVQITETGPSQYHALTSGAEALNSTEEVLELNIFPNPTSDWIALNTNALQATVELYNSLGQLLQQFPLRDGNQVVDVQALAAGVYSIRLKAGKEVLTKQFVKQH